MGEQPPNTGHELQRRRLQLLRNHNPAFDALVVCASLVSKQALRWSSLSIFCLAQRARRTKYALHMFRGSK